MSNKLFMLGYIMAETVVPGLLYCTSAPNEYKDAVGKYKLDRWETIKFEFGDTVQYPVFSNGKYELSMYFVGGALDESMTVELCFVYEGIPLNPALSAWSSAHRPWPEIQKMINDR